LVVVAVIGVLATIIISSLTKARKITLDTKVRTEVESIKKGIEMYYLDHNSYPIISVPTPTSANFVEICTHDIYYEELREVLAGYIKINLLPENRCIWYTGHYTAGWNSYPKCRFSKTFQPGHGYMIMYNTKEKRYADDYYGTWNVGEWEGDYHCDNHED